MIGRRSGKQQISIGSGCEHKGHVLHELMHTVGFMHEQSRKDRDRYVEVSWENIEPSKSLCSYCRVTEVAVRTRPTHFRLGKIL